MGRKDILVSNSRLLWWLPCHPEQPYEKVPQPAGELASAAHSAHHPRSGCYQPQIHVLTHSENTLRRRASRGVLNRRQRPTNPWGGCLYDSTNKEGYTLIVFTPCACYFWQVASICRMLSLQHKAVDSRQKKQPLSPWNGLKYHLEVRAHSSSKYDEGKTWGWTQA